MTVYGSEEAAFARVDALKRSGVWPGVRRARDGYELTCDPEIIKGVADSTGAYSELGHERGQPSRWATANPYRYTSLVQVPPLKNKREISRP